MTTFERIKELARKKDKSLQQVARELNYGENYFYSLNAGKQPTAEKLKEIADYFSVSIDYLLGRSDSAEHQVDTPKQLTVEEALSSVMSSDGKPLTDNDRQILAGIIEAYIKNKNDAK